MKSSKIELKSVKIADVDSAELYDLASKMHYAGAGCSYTDCFDNETEDTIIIDVAGLRLTVSEVEEAAKSNTMNPAIRQLLVEGEQEKNLLFAEVEQALAFLGLLDVDYVHVTSDITGEELLAAGGQIIEIPAAD